MHRPMLIILGIGVIAGVAIGFLANSFDPFTASAGIKFLFLASVCIVIVSVSTLILYAIAVAWHEGGRYFLARYFGPETPYFKFTFQGAILIALVAMILVGLRRFELLPWK